VRRQEERFLSEAIIGEAPEQLALNFGARSCPGSARLVQMLQAARLGPYGLSERERRCYFSGWASASGTGPQLVVSLFGEAAAPHLGKGWSLPEGFGRWTCGHHAQIYFAVDSAQPRQLSMHLKPFLVPGFVERQCVRVLLNDEALETFVVDDPAVRDYPITLPSAFLHRENELRLELPDAVCPVESGSGPDSRELAVWVQAFRID
jgi:hypothetical protein